MKNSRGSEKKKYVCTRYLISTFPDIWSSYSISFLSRDLFESRCSPWLKEHSLYHLIHMNYNLSSPKWQIQRSVMWLCEMRVVRKAERSTCLELDECQNPFYFSLKNRHMSQESLWPKCNCRSLYETGFPLYFISTFFLFFPQSFILYSSRNP